MLLSAAYALRPSFSLELDLWTPTLTSVSDWGQVRAGTITGMAASSSDSVGFNIKPGKEKNDKLAYEVRLPSSFYEQLQTVIDGGDAKEFAIFFDTKNRENYVLINGKKYSFNVESGTKFYDLFLQDNDKDWVGVCPISKKVILANELNKNHEEKIRKLRDEGVTRRKEGNEVEKLSASEARERVEGKGKRKRPTTATEGGQSKRQKVESPGRAGGGEMSTALQVCHLLAAASVPDEGLSSIARRVSKSLSELREIIGEVAEKRSPGVWCLKEKMWSSVHASWPKYTAEERVSVRAALARRGKEESANGVKTNGDRKTSSLSSLSSLSKLGKKKDAAPQEVVKTAAPKIECVGIEERIMGEMGQVFDALRSNNAVMALFEERVGKSPDDSAMFAALRKMRKDSSLQANIDVNVHQAIMDILHQHSSTIAALKQEHERVCHH